MKLKLSPALVLTVSLGSGRLLALDANTDRLDDVWEARYHANGLPADADSDGDGWTNAQESIAGTDPLDAASCLRARLLPVANGSGDLSVEITSQPGKGYRLQTASALSGPWTAVGVPQVAVGTSLTLTAPRGGAVAYYRVEVSEPDSDGDGVGDWSELLLEGFDPHSGESFHSGAANHDAMVAQAMMTALANGEITSSVESAEAFEKSGTEALVLYSRSGSTQYPFTLFVKTAASADTTKAPPAAGDFTLRDQDDHPVTTRLVIPAGSSAAALYLHAVPDDRPETPQPLRFLIGGSALDTEVLVADAEPTLENQRLLVAYLHPAAGVTSFGSGLATVRLPGDNDFALATVSFSNLASPVSSVQIVVNGTDGILQSIPAATYDGQSWPIRASQAFTTDQQVLDALLAGGVGLTVMTELTPAGEIEGIFQPAEGASEFQGPPAAQPVAALAGSALDQDIVRFLTQATYGPSGTSIADMQQRVASAGGDRMAAYAAWIDQQFALPVSSLLAYATAANRQEIEIRKALPTTDANYSAAYDPNNSNRRRGWWMFAMNARDQLPQRLAFALSQIFVISDVDSLVYERTYGSSDYYDMLRSKGAGSYRDLLEAVSKHPMMGYYLSHLRNQKAVYAADGSVLVSPDENYAREIMQLFSIGLVQLHPDGSLKLGADGLPAATYVQADVGEMARVFTGWSFSVYNNPSKSDTVVPNTKFNQGNGSERYESQWVTPMAMFAEKHDTGAKSAIGLSLPANQTGEKDLADVVTYLANHRNTAPFISRRLIQRFVTANPSRGYIYRVAQTFRNSGGNLPTVVKAILLDPEARNLPGDLASAGKSREPLLRAVALLRALGAKSQFRLSDLSAYGYPAEELAKFPDGATLARISSTAANLNENFMSAPTVFNFYQPDYSPAGLLAANGAVSPELQLANDNTVIQTNNYLYTPIYSSGGLTATGIPNQTLAPYNYASNGQNLMIDFAPFDALYMAAVDANGDGIFDKLDTATHNNPVALKAACEAVLDRADLLLCGGELKARGAGVPGSTRSIILDGALSIRSANNTSNSQQASVMRDRVRAILWLVMSSPECLTQK